MKNKYKKGFGLIGLVLVLAIILVIVAIMFSGGGKDQANTIETEHKAAQDVNQINGQLNQYQQQIDLQNNVNSTQ